MRTCSFCEEIVNERFKEAISPEEMRVKQAALSLLEGMLTVRWAYDGARRGVMHDGGCLDCCLRC